MTTLMQLIDSLEHDYREEHGEQVHSYMCRRSEISLRLVELKNKIQRVSRDFEEAIGAST